MKLATWLSGGALALVLCLATMRPAAADIEVPQGRVAVTYDIQLDWVYPPTGQTMHNGYLVTVYWDNGQAQKVEDNGAKADSASLEGAGWQTTNVDVHVAAVHPW